MRELIKMLGVLSLADASAEQQMQGVRTEVQKLIETKKEVDEFLKLHDSASLDKITGKIQGMCPLTEKAELEKVLHKRDAENAVAKAFSEGKLAEKSRKWALSFAEKHHDAFNDWTESAPVIIPDNKNIDGMKSVKSEQAFSDAEMKIFRTLGLTDAQIAKIKENK
jgi:phage I-like protein